MASQRLCELCFCLQHLHRQGGLTMLTNKTDTKLYALTVHMNNHKMCRHDRSQCVPTAVLGSWMLPKHSENDCAELRGDKIKEIQLFVFYSLIKKPMVQLQGNTWCNSAVFLWPDSDINPKISSRSGFLGQAVETASSHSFCKLGSMGLAINVAWMVALKSHHCTVILQSSAALPDIKTLTGTSVSLQINSYQLLECTCSV